MIETLLGGVLGGVFRLVPEFIKWLDRKNERAHELAMQREAYKFQELKGTQRMDEVKVEGQNEWNKGALDALREAIRGQADSSKFVKSGWWFVDVLLAIASFLSSSVRPVVTYWFVAMYCAVKILVAVGIVMAGGSLGVLDTLTEVAKFAWSSEDNAIMAGILNFWFLGRVLDKAKI